MGVGRGIVSPGFSHMIPLMFFQQALVFWKHFNSHQPS